MARVPGRTRNAVYRVTVPTDAYLKIFVDKVSANSWARESAALDALFGTLPVPRLIGRRSRHEADPPFVITSACAGHCFSEFMNTGTREGAKSVLREIDAALRLLATDTQLASELAK